MGFFDKIKALKNVITGGAADVEFVSEPATLGNEFGISVTAIVKDTDLKVDRVYIKIEGIEEVEVPYTKSNDGGSDGSKKKIARANTSTFELEVMVTDVQVLAANERYEWSVKALIPKGVLPVYEGKYCNHYYRARAFLDSKGNDPDSGWQSLDVK